MKNVNIIREYNIIIMFGYHIIIGLNIVWKWKKKADVNINYDRSLAKVITNDRQSWGFLCNLLSFYPHWCPLFKQHSQHIHVWEVQTIIVISLQQEHLQKTVRLNMFSLAESYNKDFTFLSSWIEGQRICLWKTSRNWPFKDQKVNLSTA